jgi:Leucine-rich repeat (LRR) protein
VLDLSYNELMSLPEDIGNLEELKLLNLRSNNLTTLPSSLKNIFKLSVLNVLDNNLDEDLVKAIKLKGPKCLPDFI